MNVLELGSVVCMKSDRLVCFEVLDVSLLACYDDWITRGRFNPMLQSLKRFYPRAKMCGITLAVQGTHAAVLFDERIVFICFNDVEVLCSIG